MATELDLPSAARPWLASIDGVDAISLLHRPGLVDGAPDAEHGIVFGRRPPHPLTTLAPAFFHDESEWENLATVRAGELATGLAVLGDGLHLDAFFSLNGFLAPRRKTSKAAPTLLTGGGIRCTDRARRLTTCFVDLDGYRVGLTADATLAHIQALVEKGLIPAPSLYCDSGRGNWCFWLLRDTKEPTAALRSSGANLRCWNRVQRDLASRLAQLGVDMQALDVARAARVPGSINSKTGSVVRYWIADDLAEPRTYLLNDLAVALGVAPVGRWVPRDHRPHDAARRLQALRGALGRALLDVDRLAYLEQQRGGFRKGMRGRACALLASSLVMARERARRVAGSGSVLPPNAAAMAAMTDGEIRARVLAMARRCEAGDFNPDREARSAVHAALKGRAIKKITRGRLADWLDVTPEESAAIRLAFPGSRGRAIGWPAATRFGAREPERVSVRALRRAHRRVALRSVLNDLGGGPVPTLQALQRLLRDCGVRAALGTIARDLETHGVALPARGRRRAARAAGVSRGLLGGSLDLDRSIHHPLLAGTSGKRRSRPARTASVATEARP